MGYGKLKASPKPSRPPGDEANIPMFECDHGVLVEFDRPIRGTGGGAKSDMLMHSFVSVFLDLLDICQCSMWDVSGRLGELWGQ